MVAIAALLPACIWDQALYDSRRAFLTDGDGDGVSEQDGDCDDADGDVYPGARETCDGFDENCDGNVDEDPLNALSWYVDGDGDGIGGAAGSGCAPPDDAVSSGGDCDDGDAAIPGVEVPYDGVDQDCDGQDLVEVAGAGAGGGDGGADCIDGDAEVFPGAGETWENGVTDNDCDGEREEVVYEYGYSAWTGATSGSQLGRRVATLRDPKGGTETIIVAAAPYDSSVFPGGGAVYLLGPTPAGDVGGSAALLSGGADWYLTVEAREFSDLDGDGVDDMIVSAPGKDEGSGAAWVIPATSIGGGVNPQDVATLSIGTTESGSYLGAGAVGLGDLTGDGVAEFSVGSPVASPGGVSNAGSIAIFSGASTGAVDVSDAEFTIAGSDVDGFLGNTVQTAGDQNSDGYQDYLVGANRGFVATILPGGRHVFDLSSDWVFHLAAPDDGMDRAPRMVGDIDADGVQDLGLIDDNVLVFTALALAPTRTPNDSTAVVDLGVGLAYVYDLADLGDLDGDGRSETLVPLQYYEGIGGSWASIFFGDEFTFGSTHPIDAAVLAAVCIRPNAAFGYRVAVGGDVGGDGAPDLVFAGYSDDEAGSDAGAVITLPVPN